MLSQPALLPAQVGGDAQGEALLALEHVAAVAGVDGHDGVVLGELDDVPLLGVQIGLGVQALDKVGGVAQLVKDGLAHPGHDGHVQHHIDGVGELNAVLGKGGTHHAHAVGDHIHGAALHGAVVELAELGVHLLRVHPVVGGAGVLLLLAADEGAALHPGHVRGVRPVEVATGQLLLVQLGDLAGGAGFLPQSLQLGLAAVDPDDLVRLGQGNLFVDPVKDVLILC